MDFSWFFETKSISFRCELIEREKHKIKKILPSMSDYIQLTIPFSFEEFKDIENYEGLYQISNYGRVYSLKKQKFLKSQSDKDGYQFVMLYKYGKAKFYYIHRIVASTFIPNPLNLSQVNHSMR